MTHVRLFGMTVDAKKIVRYSWITCGKALGQSSLRLASTGASIAVSICSGKLMLRSDRSFSFCEGQPDSHTRSSAEERRADYANLRYVKCHAIEHSLVLGSVFAVVGWALVSRYAIRNPIVMLGIGWAYADLIGCTSLILTGAPNNA